MPRALVYTIAILSFLHGLVHLFGFLVYFKLTTIKGLEYKTNILGDRFDLGDKGIRWFGAMWLLSALGFVAGAAFLFFDLYIWKPVLIGVAVLSLVITVLDYKEAYAGIVVNVAVLGLILLWPFFA